MTSQQLQANPYVAGSPLTRPEIFVGREDVFQFINESLIGKHQDNVIVLYGQRRTGKTSVLYQMHRHVDPRYLPILVDLQGLSLNSLEGFFWELASVIQRALRRDHRVDVPRPRPEEFAENPVQYFQSEFLEQVWNALGDRHLLLMVDETTRLEEQVQAGRLDRQVYDHLRSLMQHSPRLNFIFSLGTRLAQERREYGVLFNVALYKEISWLDRQAAINLITRPVESMYRYDPEAVERILEMTSGHPFYTQLLCHSLFARWQRQGTTSITVHDVDEVLAEVMERATATLKFEWDESTPEERLVLVACVEALGSARQPIQVGDVEQILRSYTIPLPRGDIVRALQNLVARETLLGRDGYRFAVEIMRLWVQQQKRMEWVQEEVRSFIESLPPLVEAPPAPLQRRQRTLWATPVFWAAAGALVALAVALTLLLPWSPARVWPPRQAVLADHSPEKAPPVLSYAVDKCGAIPVKESLGKVRVQACVLRVDELADQWMRFHLSWTAYVDDPQLAQTVGIEKGSDEVNPNMYIKDSRGTIYRFKELGGAAKGRTVMRHGEFVTGWFAFPPISKGAQPLTLVDDDQAIRIEGIVLERGQ